MTNTARRQRRRDLEAIDCSLTQSLSSIRTIHQRGVTTKGAFTELGLGGFEVATADGGRVPLPTHGGASRKITLENRLEFADMAEAFKLREFWVPVKTFLVEKHWPENHELVEKATAVERI